MTQVNQEHILKALDGDAVRTPERWSNYAVQGVPSSIRTLDGTEIPTTTQLVKEEACSQAGKQPVSCRTSRLELFPTESWSARLGFLEPAGSQK
jgi:hypothetical protein